MYWFVGGVVKLKGLRVDVNTLCSDLSRFLILCVWLSVLSTRLLSIYRNLVDNTQYHVTVLRRLFALYDNNNSECDKSGAITPQSLQPIQSTSGMYRLIFISQIRETNLK